MSMIRDAFLSEEDLDIKNLTDAELEAVWTAWLEQAQATNEWDRDLYSHGVFLREPPWTRDDWSALERAKAVPDVSPNFSRKGTGTTDITDHTD